MLVGGDGGFEWKERVSNLCMTSILVGTTHMGEEEEGERGGRRRGGGGRRRRRRRRGRKKGRGKGPHTPHAGAKKTCESAQFVVPDELRQDLRPVESKKVHTLFSPSCVVNLRPKCRLL